MADDEPRAGEAVTANYGWTKPNVMGSDDQWGGYLNADLDGIDTTVKSISNAIPVASSTTPLMNGIAAIGVGTTWARADHVHPSDVAAMNDNRIINGNFAVNQRTQVSGTALAAAAYGHDRWKAGTAGCTYTFTAALPDTTITITAGTLTQIIEAGVIEGGAYTLSWTGTAQGRVYQGTPTGSYAASPLTTASLTAGTNTIVEFNTGTLGSVKFEIGSRATSFNRQSLAKSLADCQRYYSVGQIISGGNSPVGTTVYSSRRTPVTMRATPTLAISANSGSIVGNVNVGMTGDTVFGYGSVSSTADWIYNIAYTASAEL